MITNKEPEVICDNCGRRIFLDEGRGALLDTVHFCSSGCKKNFRLMETLNESR